MSLSTCPIALIDKIPPLVKPARYGSGRCCDSEAFIGLAGTGLYYQFWGDFIAGFCAHEIPEHGHSQRDVSLDVGLLHGFPYATSELKPDLGALSKIAIVQRQDED
jgi:hypothetical protein